MANNVVGQIIGELGEVAKQVGQEAAQVPVDITGKALESLGAKSGKTTPAKQPVSSSGEPSVWEQMDQNQDHAIRRAFARKALEVLAGGGARTKKPSIWEQLQQEQDQKKQAAAMQAQAARASTLPTGGSKRPVGDLYGTKAKKLGSEVGKNVRQD